MGWSGLAILNALAEGPKLTRQIAASLGKTRDAARLCLESLCRKGLILSAEGAHQITDKGRQFLAEGREITSGPCGNAAPSRRALSLRQKAWRAMSIRDGFSLDDLLTMLCDGSEKEPERNLTRYLAALETAGYLLPLARRGEGGVQRWRLRRDRISGPEAPAFNTQTRRLTDCNTGQVFELGRSSRRAAHVR
ncbi:winged helix-turn-helix domain-containing protein [Desulfovibrio sp. JY]|nr:winged helix-turn-helix domain-containing protein [Desulfovibrio sp. JY]